MNHPADLTIDENRQQLVNAGAIPVLVSLLNSPDTDVQYYCTTALSNIAVDGQSMFFGGEPGLFLTYAAGANRKKLAQSESKLVTSLVMLMDSSSLKVQCQAALALRNLASDGAYLIGTRKTWISQPVLCFREVSARDRKGRRPFIPVEIAAVNLPSTYTLFGRMRAQRVYPSTERIAYHRIWLPPTSDQSLVF